MKNFILKNVVLQNSKNTISPESLLEKGEVAFFTINNEVIKFIYILEAFYNESGKECIGFVKTPRTGMHDTVMVEIIKDHEDRFEVAKRIIERAIDSGCVVKSIPRENMASIFANALIRIQT